MSRRFAALLAAVAATGLSIGWHVPAARASAQPEVVVGEGRPVVKSYRAITGQGQASEALNTPVPADCRKPPGEAWCDTIPVRVKLPSNYDETTDEFVTKVELSWDKGVGGNDMDLFVYDATDTLVGQSAGSTNPEKSASADAKFFVVAFNSSGPNTGYKLKLTFTRKTFTPVTEKPQNFGSTDDDTPSTLRPLPTTPPDAGPRVTAPLDLPPLDLNDPDFAAGADKSLTGFLGKSAAPTVSAEPAKPVSAGVLIVMLGVLPIGGIGVGTFLFKRRASRMLEF